MRTTISATLPDLQRKPDRTELENAVTFCGEMPHCTLTAMNAAKELAEMKVILLWIGEEITEGVAASTLGVDRLTARTKRSKLIERLKAEIIQEVP